MVANRITHDTGKAVTVAFFRVGESAVDMGTAFIKKYGDSKAIDGKKV